MIIGGLQRFSLSDFPGRIACIVFTRGCNFRCPYCHNPELVDPAVSSQSIAEEEVLGLLARREGKIEGVVATGGEPTVHAGLPAFLGKVKAMGLAVKLDTNGSAPRVLRDLLKAGLVDYVAMDIKASPDSYEAAAGVPVNSEDLRKSVETIVSSGVPHELRMTFLESLVPLEEMEGVSKLARGCRLFVVQAFQPSKTLDPRMLEEPRPSPRKLEQVRGMLQDLGLPAVVR